MSTPEPCLQRIDPRRPALLSPAGLRRIVLGSELGERGTRGAAQVALKPHRSAGPFTGCLVVLAHVSHGSLDEHAREVLSAAALLARHDEEIVLLAIGDCRDDLAAAGVDRAQCFVVDRDWKAPALAYRLQQQILALAPRHVLLADRGADADLGRRLVVGLGWPAATHVVEWHDGRVRMRSSHGHDACAPVPRVLLLERGVAKTTLPFVGLGLSHVVPCALGDIPGIRDLGLDAGDPQSVALDEADFIVSAGNGVTDVELFQQLAQALGAATGASRVAVDDGRFPRHKQIGATGTAVQARGYLAIGISGAVQHLQGIKECRHVMAINTDASAPIAQRAELTVVADAQALMRSMLDLLETKP